ncbi:ImmA/IrrE family metallo-endopeptidase [Streptomyces sp. DSM 44917]|uniref:ImmA/IrrE family metallo-endopeptidase n=1 Tax=Streptomyces boetiae TaxID=3075541 RepID=A0ABU2L3Q1_9ACTN|nr:ImmA/IrrE family metallo-endopeptidase [Streptomyces sp. DSM 44917]MDT0306183.1 ImmA/IrrE family metallo-endopeptidase [Streptomyces sp. DSM 44917]
MSNTQVAALATLGLAYSPVSVLEQLAIPVVRMWMRDTWAVWCASRRTVILASGLSATQERCILAHEVEHVLIGDDGCAPGPAAVRQERYADREAARKLIAISDLAPVAQWAPDIRAAAAELNVTERMLRIRLHDLDGEGWPWPTRATSRTAG